MFNPSSFIFPYNPSDKAIRIVSSANKIIHTVNICNYQKSGVTGKILSIVLEDNNKDYKLEFDSNSSARQALLILKQAVDTLRVNCTQTQGSTGPGPTGTIIPLTYLSYKSLQASNSLTPLQWYDVTDTTNLLFTNDVYTIRLLAKSVNDLHPRGQIVSNNIYVSINTSRDTIATYEDSLLNNFILNSDINNTSFTNSDNITIINGSRAQVTGSSFLIVENNSNATVQSSLKVKIINGSSVSLKDAINVNIDNIQQNLLNLPFSLEDVNIDRNESNGKTGRTVSTITTSRTFYSYKNLIEQVIVFNTDNNILDITLDNLIIQTNGEFKIKLFGSGNKNVINVKDKLSNILFSIKDNLKGIFVKFNFNKTTGRFELSNIEFLSTNLHQIYYVTPTNNQTNFVLPVAVTDAGKLKMFLNGVKQIYGYDFTYDSNISQVIYSNRHHVLQTSDEIEFIIF